MSVKTKQKTNKPPTTVIGVINRIRNSSVPCSDRSLSMYICGKSWHSLKMPFNACFVGIGNLMLHSSKRGEKTFSKGKKRERKARDVVCERNEAHSKGHSLTLCSSARHVTRAHSGWSDHSGFQPRVWGTNSAAEWPSNFLFSSGVSGLVSECVAVRDELVIVCVVWALNSRRSTSYSYCRIIDLEVARKSASKRFRVPMNPAPPVGCL